MSFRSRSWAWLVPLAVAVACATSEGGQKSSHSGNSGGTGTGGASGGSGGSAAGSLATGGSTSGGTATAGTGGTATTAGTGGTATAGTGGTATAGTGGTGGTGGTATVGGAGGDGGASGAAGAGPTEGCVLGLGGAGGNGGMGGVGGAGAGLFVAKINFQLDSAPIPIGYEKDGGAIYADRGNGLTYGWNFSHADVTRDRDINADQRLDTLCHFHVNGEWEIAVPVGCYSVFVSIGDAQNGSTHTLNVEGINYWTAQALNGNQFANLTKTVTVTDGNLTLDQGAGAEKATRINYIEITQL